MRIAILVATAAILTACGGGGSSSSSGGSSSTGPTTFNVNAAMANVIGVGASFGPMTATASQGGSLSVTLRYQPTTDQSYNGVTYKRTNQILTYNGTSETTTMYWAAGNPATILYSLRSNGNWVVYTPGTPVPTAGTVGQSGTYATVKIMASQSGLASQIGSATSMWSLEADTSTTALVCLSSQETIGASTITGKDCYRIDAAGNVSGVRSTGTVSGITLSMSSF